MMTENKIDPRTPVLVGIGVSQQHSDNALEMSQAYQLMVNAVEAAADDAGSAQLLNAADIIYVPKGLWQYSDPGRLVAESIGADNAKTVLAEFGILQQTLMGDACQRIADGTAEIAIVTGGEAKYRELRAAIDGVELSEDLMQPEVDPDIRLTPGAELWSQIESNAGLGMPVGYYALMECALRHARGQGVEEHRDQLAALYETFSQIAVDNPHAWNRQKIEAADIRNPTGRNKMLAFPYTKLHNTQWNVNQAAGLIFCSAEKAQALGIARDRWIFPLASTESNHMVNTSQRRELHRCPGARLAGNKALEIGDVSADELAWLDMYSCFPSAVQIYAEELGIDLDRPLTVTGGMTFGGGPVNNYVLQATCRMAELLRQGRSSEPSAKGLITSVSGMLTKQGFGLWSTAPGPSGFQFVDVTEQVKAESPAIDLVGDVEGEGTLVAHTVLFREGKPDRAVAVCDLDDGQRTVVYSEEGPVMASMMESDLCGHRVSLADGYFSLP